MTNSYVGVFDVFKIGIGPSSSHSVGPMRAAESFVSELQKRDFISHVDRIRIELFGSLAQTGIGHATDSAVLMGLLGEKPDQIDPVTIPSKLSRIRHDEVIQLAGRFPIRFLEERDLVFNRRVTLDTHPNGMIFQAFGNDKPSPMLESTYFSIGGGFVVQEGSP